MTKSATAHMEMGQEKDQNAYWYVHGLQKKLTNR